jgi:hypothetical protein
MIIIGPNQFDARSYLKIHISIWGVEAKMGKKQLQSLLRSRHGDQATLKRQIYIQFFEIAMNI